MTIDKIIPHDITCTYAAVNIQSYLNITHVIPSREVVSLFVSALENHQELQQRYQTMIEKLQQKSQEDENRILQKLKDAGSSSQNAISAYCVAYYGGQCLRRLVQHKGNEITESELSDYLNTSIDDGIRCMEEDYWIDNPYHPKPQIVNPDFKKNAVKWLLLEINKRLSDTKEFSLLDSVTLKKGPEGIIILRNI